MEGLALLPGRLYEMDPLREGYDKTRAFAAQHLNFINCMKGQDKPLITAEDSLASVQVVETAYRSAGPSQWLRVEGPA